MSKFGNAAGLASFRATLSESHPDRLFLYESTSKGLNHWFDMHNEFGEDELRKVRTFVGWWGNPYNILKKGTAGYEMYSAADIDPLEQELIDAVYNDYGFKITKEQLAWYRQEDRSSNDPASLHQNFPWTISQSVVATGSSFFALGAIQEELIRCHEVT